MIMSYQTNSYRTVSDNELFFHNFKIEFTVFMSLAKIDEYVRTLWVSMQLCRSS